MVLYIKVFAADLLIVSENTEDVPLNIRNNSTHRVTAADIFPTMNSRIIIKRALLNSFYY